MKTSASTIFKVPIRQYVNIATILLVCLFPANTLFAGITACTLDDGSVVFQDTACAATPEPIATAAPIAKTAPLGIDKTWFDTPGDMPYRADCSRAGCDCGEYYREFKHGLAQAIADALYLDGSWLRFDTIVSQMELTTHDHNSDEYDDLRKERNEAACNILMSQKTLQLYGKHALKQLQTQKRKAENMGWDNPADCDAGDMSICEHTDNIALYQRMLYDLQTLNNTVRFNNENDEINTTAKSE